MNLDEINPECFILALFIRDDGERFLLGSGAYVFKDSQQHFEANNYANDIVEVQGNDGVFLAGQVRRPTTQSFDGYVGDATVAKEDVEQYRRNFLAFFRKDYYYTVVYIFPNGTAIQRRKGFIVDAPEVKELYQFYPEYHIALNFEDINYYSYSEDDSGQEIYTKSATIYLSAGVSSGGLVWDNLGAVNFGNVNLLPMATSTTVNGIEFVVDDDGSITANGTSTAVAMLEWPAVTLEAGTYRLSGCPINGTDSTYRMEGVFVSGGSGVLGYDYGYGYTFTLTDTATITFRIYVASGVSLTNVKFYPMVAVNNRKNLLNLNALSPRTVAGITATFDDSEIIVNGTSTGFIEVVNQESLNMMLQAGTYTLSMTQLSGSYSLTYQAMALYVFNDSGTGLAAVRSDANFQPASFTISSPTKIKFRFLVNNSGVTFNDWKIGMQLERGNAASNYESFIPAGYESYAPENASGFVWDAGSGGGPTTVMVDSIDRVYPIWELTGPAENPQIAVLTTGTTLKYAGTVTSSQTLVIDMFNKTAKLNGASVIGNVTGDWVYFTPGNNRVTYTATNPDANPSRIYWQEVVG